jgi:hypothetical protein
MDEKADVQHFKNGGNVEYGIPRELTNPSARFPTASIIQI